MAIEGAFSGGRMFYPVTVERREASPDCPASLVQRYVTRILRSDGALLDVERLPAPPGTPSAGRILALSDGTRILTAPTPNGFGTWRFASIRAFMEARAAGKQPGFRPLARLLADVETCLRQAVRLPVDDDYALASVFVAATFVHRVFEAFPILLINGSKASGKSELGAALAGLCFNGLVAGRVTAAGLVRLMAECRGTVVLDDLETISSSRSAGRDVVHILKTSYKASTARRLGPARDGRVEMTDYFGPKVVTNITGADAVLLSRMLCVRTRPSVMIDDERADPIDASALRDELHVWAMCAAADVSASYAPLAHAARTRRDEIAAPLRSIAALAGAGTISQRLEGALAAESDVPAEPIEVVLDRAVQGLLDDGRLAAVAMPQLQLEMNRVAGRTIELPSAETLGRLLLAGGYRCADGAVTRRRLHGEITRVYVLKRQDTDSVAEGRPSGNDPFAFCAAPCSDCRYGDFCHDAVPELHRAKQRRAQR